MNLTALQHLRQDLIEFASQHPQLFAGNPGSILDHLFIFYPKPDLAYVKVHVKSNLPATVKVKVMDYIFQYEYNWEL